MQPGCHRVRPNWPSDFAGTRQSWQCRLQELQTCRRVETPALCGAANQSRRRVRFPASNRRSARFCRVKQPQLPWLAEPLKWVQCRVVTRYCASPSQETSPAHRSRPDQRSARSPWGSRAELSAPDDGWDRDRQLFGLHAVVARSGKRRGHHIVATRAKQAVRDSLVKVVALLKTLPPSEAS